MAKRGGFPGGAMPGNMAITYENGKAVINQDICKGCGSDAGKYGKSYETGAEDAASDGRAAKRA